MGKGKNNIMINNKVKKMSNEEIRVHDDENNKNYDRHPRCSQ